jgi:hypothetical protein
MLKKPVPLPEPQHKSPLFVRVPNGLIALCGFLLLVLFLGKFTNASSCMMHHLPW